MLIPDWPKMMDEGATDGTMKDEAEHVGKHTLVGAGAMVTKLLA